MITYQLTLTITYHLLLPTRLTLTITYHLLLPTSWRWPYHLLLPTTDIGHYISFIITYQSTRLTLTMTNCLLLRTSQTDTIANHLLLPTRLTLTMTNPVLLIPTNQPVWHWSLHTHKSKSICLQNAWWKVWVRISSAMWAFWEKSLLLVILSSPMITAGQINSTISKCTFQDSSHTYLYNYKPSQIHFRHKHDTEHSYTDIKHTFSKS